MMHKLCNAIPPSRMVEDPRVAGNVRSTLNSVQKFSHSTLPVSCNRPLFSGHNRQRPEGAKIYTAGQISTNAASYPTFHGGQLPARRTLARTLGLHSLKSLTRSILRAFISYRLSTLRPSLIIIVSASPDHSLDKCKDFRRGRARVPPFSTWPKLSPIPMRAEVDILSILSLAEGG